MSRDMLSKTAIKNGFVWGIKAGLILTLSIFLISCASQRDSKPTGREIKIHLLADKDINPNENGHPAPLNVFIYNVKEKDIFVNAGFFEIVDKHNGASQAAASMEYEAILHPGESRTIVVNINDDNGILGFIGAYRDLNDARWLATWTLPKKKKSWWRNLFSHDALLLDVHFQKMAISIKKMD